MKTLIVMRHAKSSWKEQGLKDIERPLNKRGLRDAPFMGKILQLKGVRPGAIIASPAVRAHATARAVADELGLPNILTIDPRLYDASARQILAVVQSWPGTMDNVLIVGHNPGLTDVINLLTCAELDNLPTAALLSIDFPVQNWKDIETGGGRMRYFEYPKKYMR